MIKIKAEKRESLGKKVQELREKGVLPAVLYGPKVENMNIQLDSKEFGKVYEDAGESTLISLEINGEEFPVLIHDMERDPLSLELVHVDFYQPILTEETEVEVELVFEGEAFAVKDLGGTLVKEIQEITVKALPQNLPHEIKVDISVLKSFDDEIKVKDLKVPENVTIMRDPEDLVAVVTPVTNVEEELEKPIEAGEAIVEGEVKEGEENKEEKEENTTDEK